MEWAVSGAEVDFDCRDHSVRIEWRRLLQVGIYNTVLLKCM